MEHICPTCHQKLDTANCRGVQVELCRSCGGMLIEQQRLVPLLEAMMADLKDKIDLSMPLEKVPDRGAELLCPRCRSRMNHHGYMESQWVMVDNCVACRVLWAGAAEMGVINLMFARSRVRTQAFKPRYVPLGASAQMKANRLGDAVMHLFG